MKKLSRRKAPKPEKQKSTHLIALTEAANGLGMFTIVNAWQHRVHDHLVCWRYLDHRREVKELLPYQVKVLKKITITKKNSNATKIKTGPSSVPMSRPQD